MRRELSVYLDSMRFGAAVAVFFSHIGWTILSGGFLWQMQFIGPDAVVIFFVLSGFVIQYCVLAKERNVIDYQIARFARLYSVVLPALLLTYLFDRIGIAHNPAAYVAGVNTNAALRIAAGLTFVAQSWTWNLAMFSNNPFWSLCYEFWYYQIFAAAFFFRGLKRLGLCTVCGLIAGPSILLYFPLWLAGAAAYKISQKFQLSRKNAVSLFILSLAAVALIILADRNGLFHRRDGEYLPPHYSPLDFLLATVVALNIYAATFADLPLTRIAKPIAACAGLTFALYLLHLPIFHLLASFTPTGLSAPLRGIILIVGTIPIIVGMAYVTERRKKEWRAVFRWLFSRIMQLSNQQRTD